MIEAVGPFLGGGQYLGVFGLGAGLAEVLGPGLRCPVGIAQGTPAPST
ncbi:hypothetical protein ABZ876_27665 [Streptomyces sp. NPDC046931]